MILKHEKMNIKEILSDPRVGDEYVVRGWVQSFRSNRFINISDGSSVDGLQVVLDEKLMEDDVVELVAFHACVLVSGKLVESPGAGQPVELLCDELKILGENDTTEYPLQPKKQTMEFLRENAHLRMRTRTFSSVFRIRHTISFAIHKFFNNKGFYYLNSPIITGSDAEGAGEMFKVTSLPLDGGGKVDYSEDFFGKQTNLTVSGQLQAEAGALSLGKVYTFGPTFRAENSNTSRHLAEFWMVEPEVAFNELSENIDLAEEFVKYVISYVMENNSDDLTVLDERIKEVEKGLKKEERRPMGLMETLRFVVDNDFERITYTEAIEHLINSKMNKKGKFKFPVEWGVDLASEHERWLVEKKFKRPVVVYDYPKEIKAFYMRMNEDGKTVAAMDVLFPFIGEVIGGSEREERHNVLLSRMKEQGIEEEELWWYLELRKFGGCRHSGFGLGLERLVLFITGMSNIRDVIPFPRTPGNADF